jgi:hypothetical protein
MPMDPLSGDITRLLTSWQQGDRTALERLLPLIRVQVHRIAQRQLGRRTGQTMHPSSLVQEALVRLLPNRGAEWRDSFLAGKVPGMPRAEPENAAAVPIVSLQSPSTIRQDFRAAQSQKHGSARNRTMA